VIPGSSPGTELISTTTKPGLTVRCQLDTGRYPNGIVVSDAEIAAINIKRSEFRGEWSYTISLNDHPPNRAFISRRALSRSVRFLERARRIVDPYLGSHPDSSIPRYGTPHSILLAGQDGTASSFRGRAARQPAGKSREARCS
jgi:hypothetical protein